MNRAQRLTVAATLTIAALLTHIFFVEWDCSSYRAANLEFTKDNRAHVFLFYQNVDEQADSEGRRGVYECGIFVDLFRVSWSPTAAFFGNDVGNPRVELTFLLGILSPLALFALALVVYLGAVPVQSPKTPS